MSWLDLQAEAFSLQHHGTGDTRKWTPWYALGRRNPTSWLAVDDEERFLVPVVKISHEEYLKLHPDYVSPFPHLPE